MIDDNALIGKTLSERYRIDAVIGSGGMGTVFQGTHLLLDRPVAIKVLIPQPGDNHSERIKRFNQEGRLISALAHPNIVRANDFFVEDGNLFLVMEYVRGLGLDAMIAHGRINWRRAINLFILLCDALGYAHSRDIIHRDIKPSNIMVTKDDGGRDVVKVLDFGVAKILHEPSAARAPVTKTGIVFGSPPYMSPEQCTGSAPDARSDIYSLGCVMYEVLSGEPPIDGQNSLEILHKQVIEQPTRFAALRPVLSAPAGLEQIIFRALEKDVASRYQSMEELKRDLQELSRDDNYVLANATAGGTTSHATMQSRLTYVAALLVLFVLLFIAAEETHRPLLDKPENRIPAIIDSEHTDSMPRAQSVRLVRKAETDLEKLIKKEEKVLPPNDKTLQEMRKIERTLQESKVR